MCEDLARLAAVQMSLTDSESLASFPHLTAAIYRQLVILATGNNKEVARICQTVLTAMLATLPFNQSVTLLNNTVKTEGKERAVIALKSMDRLLQKTGEAVVRDYTKDIIHCLLKVIGCASVRVLRLR